METKAKIVHAHVETGFRVQYLALDTWIDYNGDHLHATEADADASIRKWGMRTENAPREKFRVLPDSVLRAAWPSQDYIEERWVAGFQGARRGEVNPYSAPAEGEDDGEYYNWVLWEEGAEVFRSGKNLFA